MFDFWQTSIMGGGILFIGLCVGSFLNVAIHRIPRGLSVSDPKRSFCPSCRKSLPAWQNIPVVTWIIQRGKCRHCQAPIAVRYLLVEVLTGLLFFAAWWVFPMTAALLAIVLFTILVTVTFIDAEHQVIPLAWTTAGSIIALVAVLALPERGESLLGLHQAEAEEGKAIKGLGGSVGASLIGWTVGFGSLLAAVLLGKMVFGKKEMKFEKAVDWRLQEGFEGSEQLHWVIDGEAYSWDELFYRASDRLIIAGHGYRIDGQRSQEKELTITAEEVLLGDQRYLIEELKSLAGKAERVTIPREAMGMGDPHLLGMIGAFLGWPAVLFTIIASSVYAIGAAVVSRVGFGRPLPYGPFLSLGAVTWVFGGYHLWNGYLRWIDSLMA